MTQVSVEDKHLVRQHLLYFPLHVRLLILQEVHESKLLVDIFLVNRSSSVECDSVLKFESPLGLIVILVFQVVQLLEIRSEQWLIGLNPSALTDGSSHLGRVPRIA